LIAGQRQRDLGRSAVSKSIKLLTLGIKVSIQVFTCQYFELGDADNFCKTGIKLKSLILAQIERWRHALHMQVERQRGGNPGGEWRTGE
jgi:hypothetical protein